MASGHVKVQVTEARWLNPALRVLGAGAVAARKLHSPLLGRAVLSGAELAVRHGVSTKFAQDDAPPEPPRAGSDLICGGGRKAG